MERKENMPYGPESEIDKAEAAGLKALQGPSFEELEEQAKIKLAAKKAAPAQRAPQ